MPAFIYRCPSTGYPVQGFAAEDTSKAGTYVTVTCTACQQVHLVNPVSGKVLGRNED